jgi:hypothetical protein
MKGVSMAGFGGDLLVRSIWHGGVRISGVQDDGSGQADFAWEFADNLITTAR